MIEFSRYLRLKPKGLVSSDVFDQDGINVTFKRFDVETGEELDPERSFLTWEELQKKLAEVEAAAVVIRELLEKKPPA